MHQFSIQFYSFRYLSAHLLNWILHHCCKLVLRPLSVLDFKIQLLPFLPAFTQFQCFYFFTRFHTVSVLSGPFALLLLAILASGLSLTRSYPFLIVLLVLFALQFHSGHTIWCTVHSHHLSSVMHSFFILCFWVVRTDFHSAARLPGYLCCTTICSAYPHSDNFRISTCIFIPFLQSTFSFSFSVFCYYCSLFATPLLVLHFSRSYTALYYWFFPDQFSIIRIDVNFAFLICYALNCE